MHPVRPPAGRRLEGAAVRRGLPHRALVFGDLDDPDSDVSKALAAAATEALHPEYGLWPRRCATSACPANFVAGAVVFGDTDACAVGVSVTPDGRRLHEQTTLTDGFGDFEFEGLPANTTYTVTISAPGYASRELEVRTTTSIYLGDIVLSTEALAE